MADANTPLLEIEGLCISYFTRAGEIPEFTGISAPYEEPENAELIVDTGENSLDDCVIQVLDYLKDRQIIP